VLEAQRAGEVEERALDCWRGGGQRRCWRGGEAARSRRGVGQREAKKGFRVPNGPWAGLGCAGHQVND
jgi:hypothetical protein